MVGWRQACIDNGRASRRAIARRFSGREVFGRGMGGSLPTAFPAKAGTHLAGDRAVAGWVPAFAGNAILDGLKYRGLLNRWRSRLSLRASLLSERGKTVARR